MILFITTLYFDDFWRDGPASVFISKRDFTILIENKKYFSFFMCDSFYISLICFLSYLFKTESNFIFKKEKTRLP